MMELIERYAKCIADRLHACPPEDDEWRDMEISKSGRGVKIEAVTVGGEPHFIVFKVKPTGKRICTEVSCCPHLQGLAEGILAEAGEIWERCKAQQRREDSERPKKHIGRVVIQFPGRKMSRKADAAIKALPDIPTGSDPVQCVIYVYETRPGGRWATRVNANSARQFDKKNDAEGWAEKVASSWLAKLPSDASFDLRFVGPVEVSSGEPKSDLIWLANSICEAMLDQGEERPKTDIDVTEG